MIRLAGGGGGEGGVKGMKRCWFEQRTLPC